MCLNFVNGYVVDRCVDGRDNMGNGEFIIVVVLGGGVLDMVMK